MVVIEEVSIKMDREKYLSQIDELLNIVNGVEQFANNL